MGVNKPFIPFGGKTLVERVTEVLSSVFTEVIIILDAPPPDKRYSSLQFPLFHDETPNRGPMGAIETAFHAVSEKPLFVVAADMPFLNSDVIRAMVNASRQYDLLIPMLSGQLHPLHACYAQACRPAIEEMIQKNQLALHFLKDHVRAHLFPESAFRKHDPHLRSVLNINTPEDLERAQLLLM